MKLSKHSYNVHSQFGEDGIVERIFQIIGLKSRTCVEFGAGDGFECSNTANLWRNHGWRAILIEPREDRFARLRTRANKRCTYLHTSVLPEGPQSIDAILELLTIAEVDFMSVDIDGDEWFILEKMQIHPRVLCVEFNAMVPPHLEMRPAEPGSSVGSSALSIVKLVESKGYRLVAITEVNALFALETDFPLFHEYETGLEQIFNWIQVMYVVTDQLGKALVIGRPPFGITGMCVEKFIGATCTPLDANYTVFK